jgi:hypothetical protein
MMSSATWGTSCLVVLPRRTRSAAWRHAIGSPGTIAVLAKWSTVLALHCSRTVVVYPHVLQPLTALPARTSYRPIMALTSGALETSALALGTCMPSYTGRPTKLFFILKVRSPHETVRHAVTAPEPSRYGGRIRSRITRGAPESSSAGRQDPEL